MNMDTARLVVDIIVAILVVANFLRPQPALHKQFADKIDTDKKLDKIDKNLESITSQITGFTESQSLARRPIYATLHAHGNALYFIAGKLTADGNKDGEHIKKILERAERADLV